MDNFSFSKLRDLLPSLPHLSPSDDEMDEDAAAISDAQLDVEAVEAVEVDKDTPADAAPSILSPMPIDESKPKSNLDLINECDSFPYFQDSPSLYLRHINLYFHLRVAAYPDTTLGYILPSVAEVLRGIPGWTLNDDERTLILTQGSNEQERSAVVAATTAAMRETGHFGVLKGWRNELYPVYGPAPAKELLFSIERAASPLFGVVTYGIHMTAYTYVPKEREEEKEQEDEEEKEQEGEEHKEQQDKDEKEQEGEEHKEQQDKEHKEQQDKNQDKADAEQELELKLWTPRRAATKQTYGGMLDNTVAGGMATGEHPLECVVREAHEEASLPPDLVRAKARPAGTVTYFHIRDRRAGGETKLLQPECQFIYDLELPAGVEPQPCDDEVDQFYLLGIHELREKLKAGEFKPNCAVVLLDFFVRHGVLNAEEEKDFVEIVARLHRRLEFPTGS